MRTRWSAMTERQRRRFKRRYPILAISLDHLVGEDLIPLHQTEHRGDHHA